ncbi:MAG: U32 family peptidase [Oscillospiraceae bacterium]
MDYEILAPCGSEEQLLAAVRSGANAVYLGSVNFNARRNAKNFTASQLEDAVKYCRIRDVKVYITLNTVVCDSELCELEKEIEFLCKIGADAFIVQDFGVARLARQICPQMPLHASTQMTVHNLSGVRLLEQMGFTRAVLGRELSKEEIRYIHNNSETELEYFVHGALCMSVSGQCYLSSILGQRSGNRGLCAQPCRLNFKSKGREYALSLKDLSLVERIGELTESGVYSLKIEGRMKRPEYVAAAVSACKSAAEGRTPDTEALRKVFSRSGFTSGYFDGNRTVDMFGYRTKDDVVSAQEVLGEISAGYRKEPDLIPLEMEFELCRGTPARLTVSDGKNTVTVTGDIPEAAINRPTDGQDIRKSMQKCGDTPFYLDKLHCIAEGGLIIPVSKMNSMRKAALEALEQKRAKIPEREIFSAEKPAVSYCEKEPKIRIRAPRGECITPAVTAFADKIIIPVEELEKNRALITEKTVAELPLMIYHGEEKLLSLLESLKKDGLTDAITGNIGGIYIAKQAGLAVHGDYSLNAINSCALKEMKALGLLSQTLSFESGLRRNSGFSSVLNCGIISYGYLPLMTYRVCPAKTEKGCGKCRGDSVITDRMGNAFPVLCRNREYSQLLNTVPLYLGDRQREMRGYDFQTLYFTKETPKQCDSVIRLYQEEQKYPSEFTRGLYFKELL